MSIDVSPRSRAQTRAAAGAFRRLPREVKAVIRTAQREQLAPAWRDEMGRAVASADARQRMQQKVFGAGARVKAGLPAYLVAGASSRRLSGGGTPADLARPYEFGTGRRDNLTRYSRRSKRGRQHTVTRHTSRQLPLVRRVGYVVYPAVAKTLPRYIGASVRALTDRIYQAVEGH